jgi:hypothetical protein
MKYVRPDRYHSALSSVLTSTALSSKSSSKRIDPHLAEILTERLPMRSAAAYRTMVNADH